MSSVLISGKFSPPPGIFQRSLQTKHFLNSTQTQSQAGRGSQPQKYKPDLSSRAFKSKIVDRRTLPCACRMGALACEFHLKILLSNAANKRRPSIAILLAAATKICDPLPDFVPCSRYFDGFFLTVIAPKRNLNGSWRKSSSLNWLISNLGRADWLNVGKLRVSGVPGQMRTLDAYLSPSFI